MRRVEPMLDRKRGERQVLREGKSRPVPGGFTVTAGMDPEALARRFDQRHAENEASLECGGAAAALALRGVKENLGTEENAGEAKAPLLRRTPKGIRSSGQSIFRPGGFIDSPNSPAPKARHPPAQAEGLGIFPPPKTKALKGRHQGGCPA